MRRLKNHDAPKVFQNEKCLCNLLALFGLRKAVILPRARTYILYDMMGIWGL